MTITENAQTRVIVDDLDEDGYADRRITWTVHRDTADKVQFTEESAATGGGWVLLRTEEQLKTRHAGGSCEGMDNFPDEGEDVSLIPDGSDNVTMVTGSPTNGNCNFADAQAIRDAVECALDRGMKCLADTNSANNNAMKKALAGKSVMPLRIGCGNVCAGAIASTRSYDRPWFTDSKMNVNMDEFSKLDADGQCSIMLHELMHWAGNGGDGDHNDAGGDGGDDVYSCGRYCGGCSNAGHGAPGNSAIDCARCADTKARKLQCGAKIEHEEADCGGELGGVCHAGLGCIAGDCQTCGGPVTRDCDGNVVEAEATCCVECPSNCNASNDVPCGAGGSSSDTCQPSTPPHCGN